VKVEDLSVLAEKYPFVEWAVLLLPGREGQPRFPTRKWIRNFVKDVSRRSHGHAPCGQALLDFIAGKPETLDLMSGFRAHPA